jgi:hypothetical protein
MTRYWALALIVAIVAGIYVLRRVRNAAKARVDEVDLALGDDPPAHETAWPDERDSSDDTAPAVLSPPEWRAPPRSGSGGSRR